MVSLWQKRFTDDEYSENKTAGSMTVIVKTQDEEGSFEVVRGRSLRRALSPSRPPISSIYPPTWSRDEYWWTHEKAASVRSEMAYHSRNGSECSIDARPLGRQTSREGRSEVMARKRFLNKFRTKSETDGGDETRYSAWDKMKRFLV